MLPPLSCQKGGCSFCSESECHKLSQNVINNSGRIPIHGFLWLNSKQSFMHKEAAGENQKKPLMNRRIFAFIPFLTCSWPSRLPWKCSMELLMPSIEAKASLVTCFSGMGCFRFLFRWLCDFSGHDLQSVKSRFGTSSYWLICFFCTVSLLFVSFPSILTQRCDFFLAGVYNFIYSYIPHQVELVWIYPPNLLTVTTRIIMFLW